MKLQFLFLLITLAGARAAGDAEDHFRLGESALTDELWSVATIHFDALLSAKNLPAAEKSRAAIRLVEAYVRDGRPSDALKLLDESFVADSPDAPFWKGQALAGLGRFSDAVKELAEASGSSHATEAILTRSAILLSLNQPDEALAALAPLTASADPAVAVDAKLRRMAILLELKRLEEARAAAPQTAEVPEKLQSEAAFLQGQLLLASGDGAGAALQFSGLLANPAGQTLLRHHSAAIGFADSLAAQDSPAKASDSLLLFIQENPDSPLLGAMFSRLLKWLPTPLNPSHPTLDRLVLWSEPAKVTKTWINPSDYDALFPLIVTNNRLVHSLYTRAMALRGIADPAYETAADHLLLRLILEHPDHPLAVSAMVTLARKSIDAGNPTTAFSLLNLVDEKHPSSLRGGEVSFLKARAAYESGDFSEASKLFAEAADAFEGPSTAPSFLNSAIARYRETGTMTIAISDRQEKPVTSPELEADLELERALSATPPANARVAIEEFLTRHPEHPRVPEARLAAANAALDIQPPDLSMAKAQLDTIAADEAATAALPPARFALARLRLTDLSGDPNATRDAAKLFLETYPDDAAASDAALTLGLAYFRSENYLDARLTLEKLARKTTDPSRSQAAWLLAARAAALGGTPQSREEALILYNDALKVNGTLDPIIMMEKADLLINTNRLAEATDFLRKWYHSLPPDDPLRIPAGLLFGQAVTPQGGKNREIVAEALTIYEQLLKHPETKPALVNRIQYLRGMALEQLPSATNPEIRREGEALAAYYSVLYKSPNPPAEWEYLERSGFRALEILVKAEKWTPAIAIAKKIAEFKGPNADDAAKRARDIQLKNGIWED
jgi:TolA-binding protein